MWFSQSLSQNRATYVIFNCSESLKELLLAVNSYVTVLSRLTFPLAFHGLLQEDAINAARDVCEARQSGVVMHVRIVIVSKSSGRNNIHLLILGKSVPRHWVGE